MDLTPILFETSGLPVLQNRVYPTREEARACATGDIRLQQDPTTGIVTNMAFDPSIMVYDEHYNNEQSNSPRFQAHMAAVANLISTHMGREALVEVGCGKGYFLELLAGQGFDISGFDPTYEGNNPRVTKAYFGPDVAASGKGLILRHVLEHIPNPLGFLEHLAAANQGQGLIYIEVPCLDWVLGQRAWFDIFYEHVNYFRLADFQRVFGRLVHAGHSFGGQYLSIIGDLSTLRRPAPKDIPALRFPPDFHAPAVPAGLGSAVPEVVWGGASKGVIFSLMRERAGAPVARVIDINPAKQGRYLPCTGLRVLSPTEGLQGLPPGSKIRVMNPNYLDEIRAIGGPNFHYLESNDD